MKMLLVPAEGCDRATEEMWCCLSVRVSDLRRLAAMGMEIPLVSYDFFSEFYSAQIFVFPRDRGGRSLLLIAIFNAHSAYHFSFCIGCRAIPSNGRFVLPGLGSRRLLNHSCLSPQPLPEEFHLAEQVN